MKRMTLAFTILGLLAMVGLCYGQNGTIWAGVAMPRGDFGDDDSEDAGCAKTGIAVGAEVAFPLGSPGLFGVLGVSLLRNAFDEDILGDWYVDFEGGSFECVDGTAGAWYNIPIMGGVKYEAELSPQVKGYGLGLVGINIVKAPKFEWDDCEAYFDGYYYDGSLEFSWDMTTTFGYGIGFGAVINDRINLGMRYLSLGEADIEGDMTVEIEGESASDNLKWKDMSGGKPVMSVLVLSAGVQF
jgi:hypothetical protein